MFGVDDNVNIFRPANISQILNRQAANNDAISALDRGKRLSDPCDNLSKIVGICRRHFVASKNISNSIAHRKQTCGTRIHYVFRRFGDRFHFHILP